MQPNTRFWMKILVATMEALLILVAAMAIGGSVNAIIGGVALTLIFMSRLFYVTGGLGGYILYRNSTKETRRGEPQNHRP